MATRWTVEAGRKEEAEGYNEERAKQSMCQGKGRKGLFQMEECGEVDETGSRTRAGPTGAKDGRWWLTPPGHIGLGERARAARGAAGT